MKSRTMSPGAAAVRFLNGASYIHHVSYRRAKQMLAGEVPIDPLAVATMADRCDIPYIVMRELLEEYIHDGGKA